MSEVPMGPCSLKFIPRKLGRYKLYIMENGKRVTLNRETVKHISMGMGILITKQRDGFLYIKEL
jgi:hypothetical protein